MKHMAQQFDLPMSGEAFALVGEVAKAEPLKCECNLCGLKTEVRDTTKAAEWVVSHDCRPHRDLFGE